MALQDVLIGTDWTLDVVDIISGDIVNEAITYFISDESSNIHGYVDFARDLIEEVDSRIDLDFREVFSDESTTIDFYIRNWTDADGDTLGEAALYGTYITADAYLKNASSLNSNRNTFVHEFGHALGLGEPADDPRWDQDDTAMSYNENENNDFRTSYAIADWDALISLWGAEDYILDGDLSANTLFAQPGKQHADTINGFGGNDVLRGFGGADSLNGGSGADVIGGNFGRDTLLGGSGNDEINGGQGGDLLMGDAGADTIRGGGGINTINAGSNDRSIDKIYVHADSVLYGRPTDGSFADVLNDLEDTDHIYIHGIDDNLLDFRDTSHLNLQGVGIYANDALEAFVTGGLGIDQVSAMTQGGFF